MGSRSGFDSQLDLVELLNVIDLGSGAVGVGTRQTNALTNLGQQTLVVGATPVALTNSITTAQSLFAAGHASVSLQPNTTYLFEMQVFVATGATTHTTAFSFGVAGTALARIQYESYLQSSTSGTISTTAASVLDVAVATATVLNATSTATLTTITLIGTLVTGNGAVTLTPQITFSAGPTGTCQTNSGSYFLIWPVVSQ